MSITIFPNMPVVRACGAGPYGLIRYHYLSASCVPAHAFLFFGILFGFLPNRTGATNFDFHAQLFLLENPRLLWVIASAAVVGIVTGTCLHDLVYGRMRPERGAGSTSAVSTD